MRTERFRWLAGLIAAHPDRKLVGRTRLQKEVWLLQRKEMPSGYDFRMHYFGPYSEGIQAELNLLERFGLVKEETNPTSNEARYYSTFVASVEADLPEFSPFKLYLDKLDKTDVTILELAATYDMCRKAGLPHAAALGFLRSKKGEKCAGGKEDAALALLSELDLPVS